MKRLLILVAVALLPLFCGAQGLNALYSFLTYNVPSAKPYVEVVTSIDSKSLNYNTLNKGKKEATVELTLIIKRDSTVLYAQKRDLKAQIDPKTSQASSLIDIQRVELENGSYTAEFVMIDKNSRVKKQVQDHFNVFYPSQEIAISDVELVSAYIKSKSQNITTKNGWDITPYLFDAVDKRTNKISYYAEIYNADKQFSPGKEYLITIGIEEANTHKRYDQVQGVIKQKAQGVTPVLGSLDISSLPQGQYNLLIEARGDKNILYAYNKTTFYRYSDKMEELLSGDVPVEAFVYTVKPEDIDNCIRSITPIASVAQKSFIRNSLDTCSLKEKQYFLYKFWTSVNATNPKGEFDNYMKDVDYVNFHFATKIKKGYETDRGRVYLMYGKPDILIDEKFKSTSGMRKRTIGDQTANQTATNTDIPAISYMPYQIWKYKQTPFGEANKGFVFYAPQDNLSDYILLHSDAKGEPFDFYWEWRLSRKTLSEGDEGEAGIQFRRGY